MKEVTRTWAVLWSVVTVVIVFVIVVCAFHMEVTWKWGAML